MSHCPGRVPGARFVSFYLLHPVFLVLALSQWPVSTHTLHATQNFADISHIPPKLSFQEGKGLASASVTQSALLKTSLLLLQI